MGTFAVQDEESAPVMPPAFVHLLAMHAASAVVGHTQPGKDGERYSSSKRKESVLADTDAVVTKMKRIMCEAQPDESTRVTLDEKVS